MTSDMTGQTIADRYRVVSLLGTGGLATTYKALDTSLNRFAAVKVLRPELAQDPEFIQRFRTEAVAGSSLSHPNLVRVYDYGQAGGVLYIVMEYIDGGSLASMLAEGRPLGEEYAVEIVRQVGAALHYAHEQGVIHRDVKPSNILISNKGQVVLSDLGLATAVSRSSLTSVGTVLGTPTHMAPEQVRGERVDQRTDLYALGVVLYQLLTGRLPFMGDNMAELMYKVAVEPPPAPRSVNPNVSLAVEQVVLKALAKQPAQRYQSVDEFLTALHRAQSASMPQAAASPAARVVPAQAPAVSVAWTDAARRPERAPLAGRGWLIGLSTLAVLVCVALFVLVMGIAGSSVSPGIADYIPGVALFLVGAGALSVATWAGIRYARRRPPRPRAHGSDAEPPNSLLTPAEPLRREPLSPPPFGQGTGVGTAPGASAVEMITGETLPFSPPPFAATQIIREPSAMAWLLVLNGPERGRQLRLADTITMGRAPTNDIVITDGTASRQHAQLKLVGERFHIRDLGSSNGTFINGMQLTHQPKQLQDRDEIRLGNTTMLFVQAASPEDLTADAKRRLDQFDSVWKGLTRSVRHD